MINCDGLYASNLLSKSLASGLPYMAAQVQIPSVSAPRTRGLHIGRPASRCHCARVSSASDLWMSLSRHAPWIDVLWEFVVGGKVGEDRQCLRPSDWNSGSRVSRPPEAPATPPKLGARPHDSLAA